MSSNYQNFIVNTLRNTASITDIETLNSSLANKADKTEIDVINLSLENKAENTNVYTKTEVDNKISSTTMITLEESSSSIFNQDISFQFYSSFGSSLVVSNDQNFGLYYNTSGDGGELYMYRNGTWSSLNLYDSTPTSISMSDDGKYMFYCLYGYQSGLTYHYSTNYGDNFQLGSYFVADADVPDSFCIDSSNDGQYILLGDGNRNDSSLSGVRLSTNGGSSFENVFLDNIVYTTNLNNPMYSLNIIFVNISSSGQYMSVITGNNGTSNDHKNRLFLSSNYGSTWSKIDSIVSPSQIKMSTTGQYLTVYNDTSIYVSSDYGNTFDVIVNGGGDYKALGVSSTGQLQVASSTNNGTIVSIDNGKSWNSLSDNSFDAISITGSSIQIINSDGGHSFDFNELSTQRYIDTSMVLKADADSVYTRSDVDASMALKADQTSVDTALASKANQTDVDTALASKADIFNKISETADSVVIDSKLQIQNNNIEFLRPNDGGAAASINYHYEGLILKEERGGDITSIEFGTSGGDITMKSNNTERLLIKQNGNIEMKSNEVYVGESGDSQATIFMSGGATNDGSYTHSVIETRQFGTVDNSELVLFKGNDATPSSNTDRIRLRSGEINIDTFSENSTSRTNQNTIAKFDANGLRMYRNDMDIVNFHVSTNQDDNDRIRIYRYANGGGNGNNYFFYNKDHNFGKGSDRRSKENIEDLEEEDIDFLMKIRPRKYSLIGNEDEGGCCQYGMVAQEVADVCSTMHQQKIVNHYDEYIADSNTEETLGLSYESFIPLLIKTVQVQDTKIKTLEAEIEAIKAQLA